MGRTLQPEDVIARYRVVGPLGAGGMGEVYRAHDTTLERDVALKVLPAELVRNEDRVKRFILEAKSASSLSHPNIVAIYEIGCEQVASAGAESGSGDDVHYIAMELVSGKTVHDLIHREKTDLKTMLGYLAQAAEGLSKAHAAGIVHRDLKPGNVMVTNDGYAKVLDFGLAKLTEKTVSADDKTLAFTEARTGAGVVVGTVGYMSPEQVQGKSVDHRSDIFSFGCILYEAATRSRPFVAESNIDTMHRIVHDDPTPVDEINPDVPAELRRVIKRCLTKNPDQRLQSIKDLAIELREIVDEFDTLSATATSGGGVSQPVIAPRRSSAFAVGIAAVVVLGIAGIGFGLWSMLGREGDGSSSIPFQSMRMSSLMSDNDVFGTTLSGDGRYLAYIKGPTGQWSLWVRQVATGSDVQILTSQANPIRGVSFSPDGNYLYYLGRDPDTPRYSALFEVPSLGGTPRKRIFDVDTALAFSPDGARAAFVRGVSKLNQDHLVIADLETGQEDVLAVSERPDQFHQLRPAWSPDGARVVVVLHDSSESGVQHALLAIDVANGGRELVSEPGPPNLDGLNWLPDGRGLIATTTASGQSSQIFYLPYPRGQRAQITNDLDAYSEVSLSSDGASIAALRTSTDSSLWLVAAEEDGAKRQITPRSTTDGIRDIVPLDDGAISFTARKDGERQIWVMAEDGSARLPITSQAGWVSNVEPLPDGRGLFFNHTGAAGSGLHIWRADLDGRNLRQVTDGAGELLMAVSPDGQTLLFTRNEFPNELWSVALEGGEPLRFLERYNGTGRYSPDGRLFFHNFLEEIDGLQRNVYYIVPTDGGAPLARIQFPGGAADFEWLEDGSGLTYILTVEGVQNLWRAPADGGEPVQLTRFAEGRIPNKRHAPDGARILLERTVGGFDNLWTIRSGGTAPTRITDFRSGEIFAATWTRDGGKLVVLQGDVRREVVLIEQ